MKNLFVVIVSVLSINAANAMVCSKVEGSSYPQDQEAKTLATKLDVKTCDGELFKLAASNMKKKIVKVKASKEFKAQIIAEKTKKRQETLKSMGL